MRIEFPPTEMYLPDREAVEFPAVVNGARVRCVVTEERLRSAYGMAGAGSDTEAMLAFAGSRPLIEREAALVLASSPVGPGEELVMHHRGIEVRPRPK